MPLMNSPSKAAFGRNVSAEMHAGKPQKQALAIAFDVKRRAEDARRKYQAGGSITGVNLRDKQLYDRYATEEMSQGNDPLPYEAWIQKQASTQEATTPSVDPGMLTRLRQMIFGRAMGGRVSGYQTGGGIDEQLLDPGYYQSDMIPPHTAARAATMAGDRMIGNAMGAGTDVDSRARLARLIARVKQMRGQGGGDPSQAEVGSRAELFNRMRGQFAKGGAVSPPGMIYHVAPDENCGFTHEYSDGTYGYAGGGLVDQSAGALAQLGQQLIAERQGLGKAFNIPQGTPMAPPGGPPMSPGPMAGGPPPGPPTGVSGPPGAPGTPPTAVLQALQSQLGPRLPMNMGGSVMRNPRLMNMAMRDPRVQRFCGGGSMADGGSVARQMPTSDQIAKLERMIVGLKAGQARKGNFGAPPVPTRGGSQFRG